MASKRSRVRVSSGPQGSDFSPVRQANSFVNSVRSSGPLIRKTRNTLWIRKSDYLKVRSTGTLSFLSILKLSASLFSEAISAQNRSVASRLEWNGITLSALSAFDIKTWSCSSIHSCFFQSTTIRTSHRFVFKTFFLVKFLF